ncbi:unnamed protein product [Tetraodon nigroviridis]|uniref:(spotted green pufferfish) hypothetical protein n=1 Tax=Tetraodon nigroviridis TaxID=99883 RepID=Q4SAG8_TETNG|nr:unnamed protein product [Tetraodon nigroviridis]
MWTSATTLSCLLAAALLTGGCLQVLLATEDVTPRVSFPYTCSRFAFVCNLPSLHTTAPTKLHLHVLQLCRGLTDCRDVVVRHTDPASKQSLCTDVRRNLSAMSAVGPPVLPPRPSSGRTETDTVSVGSVPLRERRGDLDAKERLAKRFSVDGVFNYTSLLLSQEDDMLYVGAREELFALSLSDISKTKLQKNLKWGTPAGKREECSFKGKNLETDCFNYIKILLRLNSTHLYVCGTFAFSPVCAYIVSDDL